MKTKPSYITIEDLNVKGMMKNRCLSKAIETCQHCGSVRKNLKLSDRIYRCECGYIADKDFNVAFNLKDAKNYKIA